MKTKITFPERRPSKFPVKVSRGNASVTLYYRTYIKNGEKYEMYRGAEFKDGKRKFILFSKYPKAANWANEELARLSRNDGDQVTLSLEQKSEYLRAVETIAPTGEGLERVTINYAEAKTILKDVSVVEAARFFAKHHSQDIPDITVEKAVEEFTKAKQAAGKSDRYISDLNYRLGKFAAGFKCNLSDVTEDTLREFLDKLKLSPRSYNNFRATIISFFRWATKKKYVHSEWDAFSTIETVEDGEGAIEIFTPEEFAKILTHTEDDLIPFLVIGAFAGLRSSEICRLDWSQIGAGEGNFIEVKAENAKKTKQRRLVPMTENLKLWLKPYVKAKGQLWPYQHTYLYEKLQLVTAKAEVKWKGNALRHSYISYRMAEIQDAAKVSLEAGNSPQMIFSNYRELVTPKEATRWFSIKPVDSVDGKITWLKVEKAA